MIEIKTSSSLITYISDEDADLAENAWHVDHYGYIKRNGKRSPGTRGPKLFMHRIVLSRVLGRELLSSEFVDHIDRNPLNNTRENLRLATAQQNNINRSKQSNNTSGYKGVFKHVKGGYFAAIGYNGKRKYLGYFKNPIDAAIAYNKAATKYYGNFAVLNTGLEIE